uniref:Cytochrome P450 n=1 Tax=Aplanochytrium stocchinoi TaxID=215587 RepID=A0A6S8CJR8_9STRA
MAKNSEKSLKFKVAAVIVALVLSRKLEKSLALKRLLSSTVLGYLIYRMGAELPPKGTKTVAGRLPWMGDLVHARDMREHPVETVLKFARAANFKSFFLSMPFGAPGMCVLMDERDREYVLKKNFANFNKNYNSLIGFNTIFHDILGRGIFNVDGKEWSTHRKIAANLFTERNIDVIMSKTFVEHANLMETALRKHAREKKKFDIQLLFQSLIFDTFCKIAFGASPNSFDAAVKGEKEPFQVAFDSAQQRAGERFFEPPPIREMTYFFSIGKEAEMKKNLQLIDEYISGIIENRKQDILDVSTDYEGQKDILGLYIYHAKKSGRPELLETPYLKDMIMNFMIAGRDTTSYVLTNIISLVSENDAFEEKLVKEISQKMSGGIDNLLKNEIKQFSLADATFNEALRMYPSVANDFRVAYNDDTLPSGISLKGGTVASISNISLGRNPKYFENPDRFDPERWLYEDNGTLKCKRIDEYKFPFFWGGYRICLGKDMARQEGKIFMCILLNSFRFKFAEPRQEKFSNGPVAFYTEGVHLYAQERS